MNGLATSPRSPRLLRLRLDHDRHVLGERKGAGTGLGVPVVDGDFSVVVAVGTGEEGEQVIRQGADVAAPLLDRLRYSFPLSLPPLAASINAVVTFPSASGTAL